MLTTNHLRLGKRIALLLIALGTLCRPVFSQTTEITVNVGGPWTYVADPSGAPRIYLISPKTSHHLDAEIAPKPSAHRDPYLLPGIYALNIARLTTCATTSSKVSPYRIKGVSDTAIKQALAKSGSRYAILLPKPCYYTEKESSVSKISESPITSSSSSVKGDPYTTSAVLHYFISSPNGGAVLTGKSDDGTQTYNDQIPYRTSIRIRMQADSQFGDTDLYCDSTSAQSFLDEVNLFGRSRYVWFPYLNDDGNQAGNQGYYLDDCQKGPTLAAIQSDMKAALFATEKIQIVEGYFSRRSPKKEAQEALSDLVRAVNSFKSASFKRQRKGDPAMPTLEAANTELATAQKKMESLTDPTEKGVEKEDEASTPVLPKTSQYVNMYSPGSADCHGAQTSINDTIP
jgi:hypothetical protein